MDDHPDAFIARPFTSRRPQRLAAAFAALIALLAAGTAIVWRFTSTDDSAMPSPTITLSVGLAAMVVAAAVLAHLAVPDTSHGAGIETAGLATFRDGETQLVTDIAALLKTFSGTQELSIRGYAPIAIDLLEDLPVDFLSDRRRVRILLSETDFEEHDSLRRYLIQSWRFENASNRTRTLVSPTRSCEVAIGNVLLYNSNETELRSRSARVAAPWLAVSQRTSGRMWIDWMDRFDRAWSDANPLTFGRSNEEDG